MDEPCIFFDLPFGAAAPRILNKDLGLSRILARGDWHSYDMTVSILDAADHRLLRAGVMIAHRISAEAGQWYLSAPNWADYLPTERAYRMDGDDLPAQVSQLVRPFLRRAKLESVAVLEAKRTEYHLRGIEDQELALIRDEQVTIRRGGLAVARYRELTVLPTPVLSVDQLDWIKEAVVHAGGAEVPRFPDAIARIGAPATGLTDFPDHIRIERGSTLEKFVSSLLSRYLNGLIRTDLSIQQGLGATPIEIVQLLRKLHTDLRGLYPVVDRRWLDQLLGDIDDCTLTGDNADNVRQSETYLRVLDSLVSAIKAPRLGSIARSSAREVLQQELQAAMATFVSRSQLLSLDAEQSAWHDTTGSARNVGSIARVARYLFGKKPSQIVELMAEAERSLAGCAVVPHQFNPDIIEAMSSQEAFEAGQLFEQMTQVQRQEREDYLSSWPRLHRRLRKVELRS